MEYGGAIYAEKHDTVSVRESTIEECVSNKDGGGLYVDGGGKTILESTKLTRLEASGGNGGVIFLLGESGEVNSGRAFDQWEFKETFSECEGRRLLRATTKMLPSLPFFSNIFLSMR